MSKTDAQLVKEFRKKLIDIANKSVDKYKEDLSKTTISGGGWEPLKGVKCFGDEGQGTSKDCLTTTSSQRQYSMHQVLTGDLFSVISEHLSCREILNNILSYFKEEQEEEVVQIVLDYINDFTESPSLIVIISRFLQINMEIDKKLIYGCPYKTP